MDFKVLEKATEVLQDKLRIDESTPDISDQIVSRPDVVGSQRYYAEPYRSLWGTMVEYGEFYSFPKRIVEQYANIQCASFMGVLPEINRIWVTVDNKLFLWNYTNNITEECEMYDGLTEVILSVVLSAPKPGVFLDTVKYVLTIASPVEIVLLAITCDALGNNLKLVPTAYTVPSDNVAMVKLAGSQSGRIFMAGNDGNVYELDYINEESSWAVDLITGAIAAAAGGSGSGVVDSSGYRHKCRKINHFAWNWKLVHILPPFLKSFAGEDDNLIDITIDNVRNIVYAITSHGMLSAFYLGTTGKETHLFLSSYSVLEAARNHLISSRNLPEGSPKPDTFIHSGGSATAAGFVVQSMHITPLIESTKVHLVVLLGNGIRIYLSLTTANSISSNYRRVYSRVPTTAAIDSSSSSFGFGSGNGGAATAASGIEVTYVRSPPSSATIRAISTKSATTSGSGDLVDGSGGVGHVPTFLPSQALKVDNALYSQGVTLLSVEQQQQQQGCTPSDELVCIFEDLVCRSSSQQQQQLALPLGMLPSVAFQQPSLREGLSSISIGLGNSDINNNQQQSGNSKIHDIKESCAPQVHLRDVCQLRALYAHSATPANTAAIRDIAHHYDPTTTTSSRNNNSSSSITPCSAVPVTGGGGTALCMAGKPDYDGYDAGDLDQIALLSEMSWQHLPCVSMPLQRRFLVLTNQGVHCLRKLRPADILYRKLAQINSNNASSDAVDQCRHFFALYGALESSAMCIALACGLPCDAGGNISLSSAMVAAGAVGSSTLLRPALNPLETIQMRAMSAMLALTPGPSYKGVLHLGSSSLNVPIVKDSRLVMDSNAYDFIKSTAHDALYLVTSRILRPIWLRGIVLRNKQFASHTWTTQLIAEIRNPLIQLQRLIRGFFAAAVITDTASPLIAAAAGSTSSSNNMMQTTSSSSYLSILADPNNSINTDDMITRRMLQQSQQHVSADRALQQQAKNLEDASINALYRLITRSLQALSFLDILAAVETIPWGSSSSGSGGVKATATVAVQWSKLGDMISFKALVTSPRVHENVKKVVTDLINNIKTCSNTQAASQVIECLSQQCSYYFSPADRCAYEASKLLDEVQQLMNSTAPEATSLQYSHIVREKACRSVQLLLGAAESWCTVDAVRGAQSELYRYCTSLLELNNSIGRDGLVDLCLLAADNFHPIIAMDGSSSSSATVVHKRRKLKHPSNNSFLSSRFELSSRDDDSSSSNWEQTLYNESSALSSTEMAAALDACYHCLIQHIMASGSSLKQLGAGFLSAQAAAAATNSSNSEESTSQHHMHEMISKAVQQCADPAFYTILGDRLMDQDQHQLLAVQSPYIEEYLHRKDPQLLYSYYQRHGDFVKAANLMSVMGRSVDADIDIAVRISYLQKAVASADRAVGYSNNNNNTDGASAVEHTPSMAAVETLLDLKDTLDVAEFQQQAYNKLAEEFSSYNYSSSTVHQQQQQQYSDSQRRNLDQLERIVQRSRYSLLSITELFHEVCLPYKLWELCLLLLHVSKHEDAELMARLWRSILYRLVPESSNVEECREFLKLKRDINRIDIDQRRQRSDVLFESAEHWLPTLQLQVVQLAQQLLHTPANNNSTTSSSSSSSSHGLLIMTTTTCSFPATSVLEELEEIATMLTLCNNGTTTSSSSQQATVAVASRGWATRCYYEVGFSYGCLVEAYMEIFDHWAGKAPEKLLHVLSSTTFVMLHWTRSAAERNVKNEGNTRQLLQAVRSGRVHAWIERLRRHLSSLSTRKLSPLCSDLLDIITDEISEINRRIAEMTIV